MTSNQSTPYRLERKDTTRSRRLRTANHTYRLTFNPDYLDTVPPERVPLELPALFDRVIDDFYEQMSGQKGDRIGLGIDHPALNTPIRIPFRRFEDLHGPDILQAVEKVQQSNKDLNIDDTMDVTLVHVADPDRLGSGSGAPRVKNVIGLEAFLTRKRCIVRIKNEDQSCLARALVVAQHYAHKPHPLTPAWKAQLVRLMRTNRVDVQGLRARALFRRLGLPEGPCRGLDDLARVGRALTHLHYQLKVYSQEVGQRLLYKCDEAPPHATVLHLYHHDQHYDVITSMSAFYGSDHYCERCDKRYDHPEKHPCTKEYRCHRCFYSSYCGPQEELGIPCLTCQGWFPNPTCYTRHLQSPSEGKPSACQSIHRCPNCFQLVRVLETPMVHHECFDEEHPCLVCREPMTPDHRCYMTPLREENEEGEEGEEGEGEGGEETEKEGEEEQHHVRDDVQYVFYDFECMQDTGEHIPNLCVVQLGCGRCISEVSKNLCEHCPWREEGYGPSREIVFRGPTTRHDVCVWLTTLCEIPKKKKPNPEEEEDSTRKGTTAPLGKKRKRDGTPSRKDATKRQRHASPQQEAEETEEVEEVEEVMEVEKTKKPKNKNTSCHTVPKEDRIYVMAHNARSYDLHLILKGLSPLLVTLPTKIRHGQHILQMTLGRLCFEDSLNFIPYPLKAFPKSFGLKEMKKGYFPHFFNTRVNQTYRGPYPPAVTYDPDGMSPAERSAFLQWHTQKVQEGALFDLQEELLAYCQSDVDILRRGCADFRQNAIHSVGMDPFVEVMTAAAFTMKSFRKHDLKPNTIAILPPQGYQPKRNYSQACMHWLHSLMERDPHLHLQHARNGGEKEFTCGEGQHRYSVDGYDPATGTVYEFLGCFWHGCNTCHKTRRGEPHPVLGTSLGARYTDTHYRLSLLSQHPEVKRVVALWEHEFTKMQREDSALRAFLQGPHCRHVPGPLNPRDAFYGGRTNATRLCYEAQEGETIKPDPMPCPTPETTLPSATALQIGRQTALSFVPYVCRYPHDPDTQQVGLFDTYIDRHFKEKLEASGYPEGCTDHDAYIQEIYDKEGIRLDKDRIEKNPGRRTIAKMQLNSLWGKFGQRVDYSQNVYMNDPAQYFALWRDDRNTIEDVTVVNEHMVDVTYTQRKEFQTPHSHFNVAIAAWVTAQARGPKNYGYELMNPRPDGTRTTCKVRGFTLNYRNQRHLNFDTMKGLILGQRSGKEEEEKISLDYPHQIIRKGPRHENALVTRPTRKDYRTVYDKRRVVYDDTTGLPVDTLPFGYRDDFL
ncbi:uncharacterized protein [Haliotis cracherodii]|uniref:uncharacterized protein n=1 Tax=Haliotis cracherodii TaxID=6455 RepID=UPI0039EC788F